LEQATPFRERPHVFVIDDDVQTTMTVLELVQRLGFTPKGFTAPLPSLEQLKAVPPYAILLALGRSDAIEVIRQLEVIGYQGKVGHGMDILSDTRENGLDHGLSMLPVLQKPFRGAATRSVTPGRCL
jgi:hypothetical protein